MRVIFLLLILMNTVFAKEGLTSEKIFEGMTLVNIEKVNPLKGQEIRIDKNSKDFIFIDKDNDKADDRLEVVLSRNNKYNELSKLYMYQKFYLLKVLKDNCSQIKDKDLCLKLLHSQGQYYFRQTCKKQLKKKLIKDKVYNKLYNQSLYSNEIRLIMSNIEKYIPLNDFNETREQFYLVIPKVKCTTKGK